MARNDGIDRTSARNQALTEKSIGRIEGHNERQNETYTNPDIVQERSFMNVHFKAPTGSYADMFVQMEQSGEISTRGLKPDADHYGEIVFDVNSAYFHNHGGYEYAKQFYGEAYKAAIEIVGDEKYILSAVMHADERNRRMSEELGYDVFHYHLHVVYIPIVEKEILWSKRCKDPQLQGKVKEIIHQVSHSKKWKSDPILDENGKPKRNANGKIILKKSYSVLQDKFYEHMIFAGYTDIQRGEKGSTEEHLTTLQFKALKEAEYLSELEKQESVAAAEAEKAEAAKLQAQAEVKKAQQEMKQITNVVKNAEAFAEKLGEPETLLPTPSILESAKSYRQNTALPVVKKLVGIASGLFQKLTELRIENKRLQAENERANQHWQEAIQEADELRPKANKFDKLLNLFGLEEIERLLKQYNKQQAIHNYSQQTNR